MEYFGLGRGYGIATALVLVMLYYFKKSVENNYSSRCIILAAFFGILACYANSTAIIGVLTVALYFFIVLLENKRLLLFIKQSYLFLILLGIAMLYILIYHFNVTGTGKTLIGEGQQAWEFLKSGFVWMYVKTEMLINISNIFLICLSVVTCFIAKKKIYDRKFFILLIILIIALIVPFKLLNKPYLRERCLIPFIPFFVLGLCDLFAFLIDKVKNKKIEYFIEAIIIIFLLINFAKQINISETYDFNNNYPVKKVAYTILAENRKITEDEKEKYSSIYSLIFYKNKILKLYDYNIFE